MKGFTEKNKCAIFDNLVCQLMNSPASIYIAISEYRVMPVEIYH